MKGSIRFIGCLTQNFKDSKSMKKFGLVLVLLKNRGNLLPLDISKIKLVAVISDNAKRTHASAGQRSEIKAWYEESPYEAISKKYGDK